MEREAAKHTDKGGQFQNQEATTEKSLSPVVIRWTSTGDEILKTLAKRLC